MNPTNELYTAYEPMVNKFVNLYSEKYAVDKDELMGEALIIFCNASKSFDAEKKLAFSTHLWHQLRDLSSKAFKEQSTLNIWYGGIKNNENVEYNQGIFEYAIESIDFSNTKSELMIDIASQLSSEAQTYLSDLFYGVFTEPKNLKGGRPQKFPIDKICNHYGWSKQQANSVKNEIKEWWNEYRMVG